MSHRFLKSMVTGMGFVSGTIIVLHLYTSICWQFDDEEETKNIIEKDFENKEELDTKETQTNAVEELDNTYWCNVFRRLSHYSHRI